ncbi:MAG: hypothetical protein CMO16_07465 [Thaumarchaeota archaeon]|nr:hypothetical protein [Nitrososphaerota archaeon]
MRERTTSRIYKKPDPSCKVENTEKKNIEHPDKAQAIVLDHEEWANTVSEEWWGESDNLYHSMFNGREDGRGFGR